MKKLIGLFTAAVCLLAADNIKDGTTGSVRASDEAALTVDGPEGTIAFDQGMSINMSAFATEWVTNITWRFTGTNEFTLTISTNLATNWFAIETNRSVVAEVGWVQTNRQMNILYRGITTPITMDVLGRREFPTENRKVSARRR